MGVDGASGNKTDDRAQLAARFPRLEQTFPALTPQEIARMRRFGEVRSHKDGERLFETGKPGPGMFVILSGHVAISQRDGLGHVTPVIDEGPGQFLAEIGQLSGRAALVDGHAEGDVETLLIPPERLRALLVAEADLAAGFSRALRFAPRPYPSHPSSSTCSNEPERNRWAKYLRWRLWRNELWMAGIDLSPRPIATCWPRYCPNILCFARHSCNRQFPGAPRPCWC